MPVTDFCKQRFTNYIATIERVGLAYGMPFIVIRCAK